MRDLSELSHHSEPLQNGGEVLVLDTGAVIDPESQAMLAALHSRSIGGIRAHLSVLAEKGPQNFMSRFYVGYGHKSIGDNGSVSVFVEGVSMLVAKAIQDFRLYNGQESSTRYIDFKAQLFADPLGSEESNAILEAWRTFYLHGLDVLPETLKERYPRGENEKPATYEKAIHVRAFDIMRAFLPAGATTNVAWHGEMRTIFDRLPILRMHPLEEVRKTGEAIDRALRAVYPSSFTDEPQTDDPEKLRKHAERKAEAEAYLARAGEELAYFDPCECPEFAVTRDTLDREFLAESTQGFCGSVP